MTRELGPLITAIVVIGRSGSAFAAEIGTMKVTEEIDALETMAIDPIHFLVTPKFIAMIVDAAVPNDLGQTPWDSRWRSLWRNASGFHVGPLYSVSLDALFLRDITTGLIQERYVRITITAVGCHEGLSTGAGAEQVGPIHHARRCGFHISGDTGDLVFTALFFFMSER